MPDGSLLISDDMANVVYGLQSVTALDLLTRASHNLSVVQGFPLNVFRRPGL